MERRVSPRRQLVPSSPAASSSSSSTSSGHPVHVGVLTPGAATPVSGAIIDMGYQPQQQPRMPALEVKGGGHYHGHHHVHHHGVLRLLVCAGGIYCFFLSWGLLQERIATVGYVNWQTGATEQFRSFILLNWIQALLSSLMALGVLLWRRRGHQALGDKSLWNYLFGSLDAHLWREYAKVAVTGSLASPFGYAALKHINYPTMVLGKSCKLVPVLLLNVLVYRRRFEWYKYVTVVMITLGVALFMWGEGAGSGSKHGHGLGPSSWGSSLWGLGLLLVNLLLDGATNSIQDHIFHHWPVSSLQMMLAMSCLMTLLQGGYLLATAPFGGNLPTGLHFIATHPTALPDLLAFGACGGLGQLFIFYTISHFGSLSLVTITVTRKLFTILLSLFWFNHRLKALQWLAILIVFCAMLIETYGKRMIKTK